METTIEVLHLLTDRLNELTKNPMTSYIDGSTTANIGNYFIDETVKGVALNRIVNTDGHYSTHLHLDRVTRRRMFELLHTFIHGIHTGLDIAFDKQEELK